MSKIIRSRGAAAAFLSFLAVLPVLLAASGGPASAQIRRFLEEELFNREGKRASCDTYAKIAVIQSRAADKYDCHLRGPEWNTNERDHYRWCLHVSRSRLLEDVRSRYHALNHCFERLGDEDYDVWRRRHR